MDDKRKDSIPHPGLPEALHPEIGNGSAFESETHALKLRSPDPSKSLEQEFKSEVWEKDILLSWEKGLKSRLTDNGATSAPSDKKSGSKSSRHSGINQTDASMKPVHDEEQETLANSRPSVHKEETKKPPKPGKLVRKAAKAAQKDQKELTKRMADKMAVEGDDLSPYTRWLKGLRGSEYVHPYDDDSAFRQELLEPKEGISETFADLLALQGHKERAIEMYQRLMEKYPEKSSFFAAKIEGLR